MKKTTSFHRLALAAAAALTLGASAAMAQEATPADAPWMSHRAVENMDGVVTWQARCYTDVAPGGVGEVSMAAQERVEPSCEVPYRTDPTEAPAAVGARTLGVQDADPQCRTAASQVGGGEVEAGAAERSLAGCDATESLSRADVHEELWIARETGSLGGVGEAGDSDAVLAARQDVNDVQTLSTEIAVREAVVWQQVEADLLAGRAPDADVMLVETDAGPALLLVRDDLIDNVRLVQASDLPVATVYE